MAKAKSPTKPLTRRLRPVLGRGTVVSHLVIVNNLHIGYVHKRTRNTGWYATNLAGQRVYDDNYDTPEMAASVALAVGIDENGRNVPRGQ